LLLLLLPLLPPLPLLLLLLLLLFPARAQIYHLPRISSPTALGVFTFDDDFT
jgi:hypothetical protein